MDLKQIQITGGAKEDYDNIMKSGRKKRTTRKGRKEQAEGSLGPQGHQINKVGGSNGALISLAASHVPSSPNAPPPVPVTNSTGSLAPAPTAAPKLGGAAKPKVVLEPKKTEPAAKQLPKVKLEAPKTSSKSSHNTKKARKIRVSLNGLGKRITRHKKIQKESKVVPIEQIKKILIEAKLIKPESKAPETMLRQIFADYQTLKNKAL